jgi:hypothetical protein
MGHMILDSFNRIVGSLKGAGLVEEENFVLTWIGPR